MRVYAVLISVSLVTILAVPYSMPDRILTDSAPIPELQSDNLPPYAACSGPPELRVGETGSFNGNDSYDPDSTSGWGAAPPLQTPRRGAGIVVDDEYMYVIGGGVYNKTRNLIVATSTMEIYNPATEAWTFGPPMPTARELIGAAVVDGIIYVIGGVNLGVGGPNGEAYDIIEAYDPASGTWSTKKPAPYIEQRIFAVGLDERIYVYFSLAGGPDAKLFYAYDPEQESWARLADLPVKTLGPGMARSGDHIRVIGGISGGPPPEDNKNWGYSISSDAWTQLANVTTPRVDAAASNHAGRVWLLGGQTKSDTDVTAVVESYNTSTDDWKSEQDMLMARQEFGAVSLGGLLYAVGGKNWDEGGTLATVERYGPWLTYRWDFDDGSSPVIGKTAIHIFQSPGAYDVKLTVRDPQGAEGSAVCTVLVAEANRPPSPSAGGPYLAAEGSAVVFDASASVDSDGDSLTFRWDFQGDGTWDTVWSPNPTASFTWGDDWQGSAILEASDGNLTANDTALVIVENVLPSGMITIANSWQLEGEPIEFAAHITDPGSDDIHLAWKWGFGAPDEETTYYNDGVSSDPYPSPDIHPRNITDVKSHIYGDNGAFTVSVFIQDDDSGIQGTTLTITASPDNLPPSVNVSGGMYIDEGQSVSLTAIAVDPGSDDLKFLWTWGEGSSENRIYYNNGVNPDPPQSPGGTYPFTATDIATHPYGDNGQFSVMLTVTDDDGGSTTWSGQVIVANLPPEIEPFGPFTVNEGSTLALSATATDSGSDDLTFKWTFELGASTSNRHFNDGLGPDPYPSPGPIYPFTATDSAAVTYGDNGIYNLDLTVTDDDGGVTYYSTEVTVLNLPPAIGQFGPFTLYEGSPISVVANATDPGSDDLTFNWSFELGPTVLNTYYNGGVAPDPSKSPWGTFPFTASDTAAHTYGDNAVYNLTLTVADDDGGSSFYTTAITVNNLPPEIAPFGPFHINEADPLMISTTAADAGSDDLTFIWTWDYGPDFRRVYYNDKVGLDPPKSPWGIFPFTASDSTSHTYGDDGVFNVSLMVEDDDGGVAWYNTTVTVDNVPPIVDDLQVYVVANLTLRVAGEKWHDVCMTLVHDDNVENMACVVRYPGSPDGQSKTMAGRIQLIGDFRIILYYTPEDDPINGRPNGANPAWVIIELPDGSAVSFHHTFNVQHNDTWVWTIDDLKPYLVGQTITFNATASDVGSDDLTFMWSFGDSSPDSITTYFNDGIGPDPYPSPGGTFPFAATDVCFHAFTSAGTYTVTLRVSDDDGGAVEVILVVDLN